MTGSYLTVEKGGQQANIGCYRRRALCIDVVGCDQSCYFVRGVSSFLKDQTNNKDTHKESG